MMTMMQQNLLSSVIERIIKVEFLPRLAAHSCCKDIIMGEKSLAFRPLICVKKQSKHHKFLKECRNITGPFRDIRQLEPWLGHQCAGHILVLVGWYNDI